MSKSLKKLFTFIGVILFILLVAMIAIPFLFKDKIKTAVIDATNEQINAKVSIEDFGLNLFSDFPNATLTLNDAYIKGTGEFDADTLLKAKSASITIDIYSLFGNNYEVSKINIENAKVFAKVLHDGKANWDIMKVDSSKTEESESTTAFHLKMQKISLHNCDITYEDLQSNMKTILTKWNGEISGDFSASETVLKTESTIKEVTFVKEGVAYLNRAEAEAKATLNANFDKMKFTFTESQLKLNELKASIDGYFAMVGKDGMDFDLKLNAPNTQFKDILSLVPSMYTTNFKNVKTSGTASLDGFVKGVMENEKYPAFNLKINVANAMFQYPSLPKSVDNINADLIISSLGGSLDNTIIDISKFSFNMGGNPFSGNLHVTNPMSDPNLKMYANGTINLSMIKEVYPLQKGVELNGTIVSDINVATRVSAIEKEDYDNVSATGHLNINSMTYKGKDMPEVFIDKAAFEFSPKYVDLSSFDAKIGKNDISATGRLENFIAYAMKDYTLKGQLNIKSNYLNANDFMTAETSGSNPETSASEDIIIPKNIDFSINANLKQVVYNKINITNMEGSMTVKNGILTLNNVHAQALGGSCKVDGTYDTSNPKQPKVNFALDLNKVSFAETFKTVESIQKFAPIFEHLLGTYSMNINFNTSFGASIMQTLAHLTGNGTLKTNDVKVDNVAALTALSSALKTDVFKSFSTKDLNIPFSIDNGKIKVKPFSMNIGNGGVMKLEGTTGLDQSIDYKGTVTLPKSLANNFVNNIPITITGTYTSPKIGIDTKALLSGSAENALGNLIGKKDEEGNPAPINLAEEKAKQIEKLRTEADNAANRIVEEAEKQSAALTEKAGGNPIAKVAAQTAGRKLVDEAKKHAQKLRDEAEVKIKELENK